VGITQRKVEIGMHQQKLESDLQRYADEALTLGASRAAVVPVDEIPVDDRVILKCQIPRCFGYGVCANCPPHTIAPAQLRELLARYRWAVFVSLDVPAEVIVRDRATITERVDAYRKVFDIVAAIESRAFYDAHYLAFGLAAGSCRHTYCSQAKDCAAMSGERCRFPLKSRPSMEAVGIDVFRMAARLGWDIYPTGSAITGMEAHTGNLCGLVVVQ
jgi:predicted metal-binding protein